MRIQLPAPIKIPILGQGMQKPNQNKQTNEKTPQNPEDAAFLENGMPSSYKL